MNNLTSFQLMHRGCKAFVNPPEFPLGSNTEIYNDLDFTIVKTDNTAASKYVYDLGWMPDGATIVFEIDARRLSGSDIAIISFEDRTGYGITEGRQICSKTNCIDNVDYEINRVMWTVRPGHNYVTMTITGATADIFSFKFRNPRFKIMNGNAGKRTTLIGVLKKPSSITSWEMDTDIYINDGFEVNSITSDTINVTFPKVLTGKRPIAHATMDISTQKPNVSPNNIYEPVAVLVNSINDDNFDITFRNSNGDLSLDVDLFFNGRIYISITY